MGVISPTDIAYLVEFLLSGEPVINDYVVDNFCASPIDFLLSGFLKVLPKHRLHTILNLALNLLSTWHLCLHLSTPCPSPTLRLSAPLEWA